MLEYLYRVVAKVSGGGVIFSEWITVRTGNDSKRNEDCRLFSLFEILYSNVTGSSSGRFQPEIDYDGMKATIQWTGPPTVLKDDDSSYDIDIYTCAVCLNTTISSCYHVENTTLPHQLKLSSEASLAMYTVKISASVLNRARRLTSNFSTPVVTKPKGTIVLLPFFTSFLFNCVAISRVCECNKGEGVFSFVCNKTEYSDCFSFNTSSCETMLERSSSFCLGKSNDATLFTHLQISFIFSGVILI